MTPQEARAKVSVTGGAIGLAIAICSAFWMRNPGWLPACLALYASCRIADGALLLRGWNYTREFNAVSYGALATSIAKIAGTSAFAAIALGVAIAVLSWIGIGLYRKSKSKG